MDFTKREQKLLKYIEQHATSLHLYVISLTGVLFSITIGMMLGIRGIFNLAQIHNLVFICTFILLLFAIGNFRVASGIIKKYQNKLNEFGVK